MAMARDYGAAKGAVPHAECLQAATAAEEGSPLAVVKATVSSELRELTLGAAFAHQIKGRVAVGIWALPFHFARVGPSVGLTLLGVVIAQSLVGQLVLLQVQRLVAQRRGDGANARPLAFEDLGFEVFGSFGKRIIQIAILSGLLGGCAVFMSMIASNLRAFWPELARDTALMIVGLMCGVLSLLPDLRSLTYVSALGNACILLVLCGMVYASLLRLQDGGVMPIAPPTRSMHSLVACVSAGFFAFDGITSVLPVGNAVKIESSSWYPTVLTVASAIVASCYLFVGFLGATAFPEIDTASITAYLVRAPLFDSVLINQMFVAMSGLVSVSVLATFPLSLFFAMQVSDSMFGLTSPTLKSLARLGAVGGCVLLDLALPKLDLIISFVGGATGASLAAFPYMLHAKLLLEEKRLGSSFADTCRWAGMLFLDLLLMLFCGAVMVLGLYDSVVGL